MPGSPWGQVVGSLPSPHYPHSSPQSPASQVLGASPPALPAPGDPALGSGEHPQMVRSACPLCRTPRQGTDGEQAAGGGGQPPPPQLQALSRGPRAGQVPRLGRSAVHITGRLCDRDGEAFRSSRGRHRPGGSEAGDLEKQRSEQQRQQTSERTRGIATPRLLRLSRGGRRQPRSDKGLSGWQGQQRLQRLDAPRQSFRKSGPVPAVSESPSSCPKRRLLVPTT